MSTGSQIKVNYDLNLSLTLTNVLFLVCYFPESDRDSFSHNQNLVVLVAMHCFNLKQKQSKLMFAKLEVWSFCLYTL